MSVRLVDDDTSDVWYDLDALVALAETWEYGVMPSLAARYSALEAYAEKNHAAMDAGARAAMCAAAVKVTPAFTMTAYQEWGVSAERRRLDEAARERARRIVAVVTCVALARERGAACTPLARALASVPSGVLAMVGHAAARA
jgi:hypothetical protein